MWRVFRSVMLVGMLLVLATRAAPAQEPRGRAGETAARAAWIGEVSWRMERDKVYPPAALARREHGVVHVEFILDRQGRVTASRIVRSSGSKVLDDDALDLVRRVQPFPPPPPDVAGARINLTQPVRYVLPPPRCC